MKNILVPTDFSNNSRTAALYAAVLARLADARLVLLHVLPPIAVAGTGTSTEEMVQQQLDSAARELHTLHKISVTRLLKPGFATDEIPQIAKRIQADLVVVGAKGLGNAAGTPTGTVAAELLKSCPFPLVCFATGAKPLVAEELQLGIQINEQLCNPAGLLLLQQYNTSTARKKMG